MWLSDSVVIAEFIKDDEVHAGEVIGEPALPGVAGLVLKAVDEIDHVVESAAGAGSNAASGDRDRQVGFAGARAADQDGITLLGKEFAAGKVAHQGLVDRPAFELEVVEVPRLRGSGATAFCQTCSNPRREIRSLRC